MTGWRQRYSKKEAFNRITRAFQSGNLVSDDTEGAVTGELLSENQAVSELAEILNDSLPGETPTVPDAIRATVAEAEAGTNDTKAVTPLGLNGAMGAVVSTLVEHGQVYCTGSAVSQALSTSWLKPTGVFTADGLSSTNVTPSYSSDQVSIQLPGTYLVGVQASLNGGAGYTIRGTVFMGDAEQPQLAFEENMVSGTTASCSAIGTISTTGTNSVVDLRFRSSGGTPTIALDTASLQIIGIPVI